MGIRILAKLKRSMDEYSEKVSREIENILIKSKLKNKISEMKNMLEGIKGKRTDQ